MAIHKTVRMIEEAFDVETSGSNAKQERPSVLRSLKRKYTLRRRYRH